MENETTTTTTEPTEPTMTDTGDVTLSEEQFTELIENMDEQNELLVQQNEILQQQLDIQSSPVEFPENADYSESFQAIVSQLDSWNDYVVGGGSALVTYSTFYIPLLVILGALYWFFHQFMTRYI